MSKKDRMLSIITNKVNWFMTKSSFEVIPYNELPQSVFNRVKEYFASDAKYEDIVCLISTSILETGKCGVLFTKIEFPHHLMLSLILSMNLIQKE